MEEISISDKYLINRSSSSKGVRLKYYIPSKDIWYKQDSRFIEEEISNLLQSSSVIYFVHYKSIIVNGKHFCMSHSYLNSNESEKTFARIIEYITGKEAGDFVFGMSNIKDRFLAVCQLIQQYTGCNPALYMKILLYLDLLIGNPDRHFNNMVMIYNHKYNTWQPAPIFDNGEALNSERLRDCGNFGGKHEYVLSSLGLINSPIRFDYNTIKANNKVLKEQLEKYESVFRYTGNIPITEFGRRVASLPNKVILNPKADFEKIVL